MIESDFSNEEIIDEYADRYEENEDQTDSPVELALDEYFAENKADLRYYTFFRRYSDWHKQLDEFAHTFEESVVVSWDKYFSTSEYRLLCLN